MENQNQKFSAGEHGGLPPSKEGQKIDTKIAHWCLFAPRTSGMYETVREMIFAENQIDGVLAGFCSTPGPKAPKAEVKRHAEGGMVDAFHPELRTQDWGWARKWADVHIIHSTMATFLKDIKPKVFFHHGTPEACLVNDLEKGTGSFLPAAAWTRDFELSFVTSSRAKKYWEVFDYTGNKV